MQKSVTFSQFEVKKVALQIFVLLLLSNYLVIQIIIFICSHLRFSLFKFNPSQMTNQGTAQNGNTFWVF